MSIVHGRGWQQENGGPQTFFCYLLKSINPEFLTSTYIGFTTDPIRRILQHNRSRVGGAKTTGRRGPWEMVACVHGFPTKIAALQFEWAWQYPAASRLVRKTFEARPKNANAFTSRAKGKLALLYNMLALPPWKHWDLHVRYLTQTLFDEYHMTHLLWEATRAKVPPQVSFTAGPLQELEWFLNSTPAKRREQLRRGEGDTIGEEPQGLHVARFKSRGGAVRGNHEELPDRMEQKDDDEEEDEEEELDEDEQAHEVVDDDGFPMSQSAIPASSSAAIAAVSQVQAASAAQLDDDDDADFQHQLRDSFGFQYDEGSNSFVLVSDDEGGNNDGVMEGGVDEEEIDMTVEHAPPPSIPAGVAAASSSNSSLPSSSPRKVLPVSSCRICQTVPPAPSTPQATSFGFQNLLSTCPACKARAHLLCWQKELQTGKLRSMNGSTAPAASSSSSSFSSFVSLRSIPLLPEAAPCPFCKAEIIWCHLVENCHRFHAPPPLPPVTAAEKAAAVAAANSGAQVAPPPDHPRTISQYMLDAAKKCSRIIKLLGEEEKKQKLREKAQAKVVKEKKASAGAAASTSQAMDWSAGEDKENLPSVPPTRATSSSTALVSTPLVRGSKKRRSRSLTPTREHAIDGSQSQSQSGHSSLLPSPDRAMQPQRSNSLPQHAGMLMCGDSIASLQRPKKRAKGAGAAAEKVHKAKLPAKSSIPRVVEEDPNIMMIGHNDDDDDEEIDMTDIAAPAPAAPARLIRSVTSSSSFTGALKRSAFAEAFYAGSVNADEPVDLHDSPMHIDDVVHLGGASSSSNSALDRLKAKFGDQIVLSL